MDWSPGLIQRMLVCIKQICLEWEAVTSFLFTQDPVFALGCNQLGLTGALSTHPDEIGQCDGRGRAADLL